MTKRRTKGWPMRMWAVCYTDIDRTPGWVPYSGSLFYSRDEAEKECSEHGRIMVVYVHPTAYIRRVTSCSPSEVK